MMQPLPSSFVLGAEAAHALRASLPVVALESAVITHGLPRPDNLLLAQALEQEIREQGATPATIGLLDGKVHVGLSPQDMNRLANEDGARKISRRDFGLALARAENGGTTVAGTLIAARAARIQVFATGGIGGVHRGSAFDVSADLPELGRSPLVVVCAGAKSILDLPATLEVLETMGVPVIGYGTDTFPAFYSASSGLPVTVRADNPQEIANMARAHWQMGLDSALLVVQPPPETAALPRETMDAVIAQALREAEEQGITGAGVTPFLLDRVSHLSGGASLQANLALLRANARLAAQIARVLQPARYI
jgi:pseudouridine-5'-phosphate glycosidase